MLRLQRVVKKNLGFIFGFVLSAQGVFALTSDEITARAFRIDQAVEAGLEAQGMVPNAEAADDIFLRRAYLDIAGRIPTIEEAEAFVAGGKDRAGLVADLLRSDAFVSHSYNWWADVLRLKGANYYEAGYQLWVREAIEENLPYDEMVRQLVGGVGYVWEDGNIGYYFRDKGMPLDNMSNTVRIFLGTRLECAQCHDHPFDEWTQMDYFQMAAFSYRVDTRGYATENKTAYLKSFDKRRNEVFHKASGQERFSYPKNAKKIPNFKGMEGKLEKMGTTSKKMEAGFAKGMKAVSKMDLPEEGARRAFNELYNNLGDSMIQENEERVLKLPHDYQYDDAKPLSAVTPRVMFANGESGTREVGTDMKSYVEWMTAEDNPRFTKVIANRLWKRAFGIGVFEPVDDLTAHTEPSNEALMGELVDLLKELNYDTRAFLEVVYNTKAYQREATQSEFVLGVPYYFEGPLLRRFTAEQIWDSMVGLCIDDADEHRPGEARLEKSLGTTQARYEALEAIPLEQFSERAEEAAHVAEKFDKKLDGLRETMLELQEAGDDEKLKQIRLEFRDADREYKAQLFGAFDIGRYGAATMMMSAGAEEETKVKEKRERSQLTKRPEVPEHLEKKERKAWINAYNRDLSYFKKSVSDMARASELQAPARRGHFLREFGQSDREAIQNANDAASVPQALNLLNGTMIEALASRFGTFGRRLAEAETDQERVDMIFQAMLTRQPTETENGMIAVNWDSSDPIKSQRDLIWSLMNTQQFLFVE